MKYRITSIVIWIAELLYRSVFSTFDFNSISGIRNGKPLFRCVKIDIFFIKDFIPRKIKEILTKKIVYSS